MTEGPQDLETLIQDVKTIKAILNGTDAPMPRFWRMVFVAATLIAVLGVVRYLVPGLRQWGFIEIALFYWLPAAVIFFTAVMIFLSLELKKTGKGFIHQSRVQNLLFVRFIIPPALLAVAFIYSQSNQPYSFEGFIFLLLAVWATAITPLLPLIFRSVPVSFLLLGFLEILVNLRGAEVVLFNTLVIASALAFGGSLFLRLERDRPPQEAPRG